MTESYPLQWPDGWPRNIAREWSLAGGRRNSQSFAVARDRLLDELRRLGAKNVVLSTDRPLRRDGLPYAKRTALEDPGAAVYFTLKDRQLCIAQDRYELMEDNVRSIAIAIEHMRGLERHGGGHMMDRAFAGFEALPAPTWRADLSLPEDATLEDAERNYKRLARDCHADGGGDHESMVRLNAAIAEARRHLDPKT